MRSSTWIRFTVVLAARGMLAALMGLAFWAVAPLLLGWHSTTVMTGSMEPSLHPGDVVVSKTVSPRELRKGQVLLFTDPDHPDVLRLHRFHALNTDGTLTTKGDANPAADSTHITRGTVLGVGYFRIPVIATPILWATEHRAGPLAALSAGLVLLTALAVFPAAPDRDADSGASAPRLRHRGRHRARTWHPRATTSALVAAACTLAALAVPAPAAAATFAATATTPLSALTTATAVPVTALTCTAASNGSVTIGWNYAGETPKQFTTLIDGAATGTVSTGTARATTISSWDLFTWKTSTVSIRTDLTDTWTTASTSTVRIVTVRFLGIGRTSCA